MRCSLAVLIGLLHVCALLLGAASAAPPQIREAIPGTVRVGPNHTVSHNTPWSPAPHGDGISRDATTVGGGVLTRPEAEHTLVGALTPQAPAMSVIALVCPNVVDLAWDHSSLTHSENGQPCVKDGWWAIVRGTSPDYSTWKTHGFAGPWGDGFYRDEDVESGETY